MPIIQRPDLTKAIRSRYELSGPDPVTFLAPEIVPVTIVDSLLDVPEGEWRSCWGISAPPAGGAGTYAFTMLFNPASSGVLVSIDSITISQPNGDRQLVICHRNSIEGTQEATYFRDYRITTGVGPPRPVTQLWYSAQGFFANIGTIMQSYYIAAYRPFTFDRPIVLVPGVAISAGVNAANEALGHINFTWKERALFQTEA